MPFWFWNDELKADELVRQIADFERHGVYGFVIHPRIGLPHDLAWMSDRLLDFYDVAIEEAARRRMKVLLYDEGMYPSGSSAGQVVATNPAFACRGLARLELEPGRELVLPPGQNLVTLHTRRDGTRVAVLDRPIESCIRGLHYQGEGPEEITHPAADLLNPEAVETFLHLVYDKFAERFGPHFGTTIMAMFTDEPSLLGRPLERDIRPGTTGILEHVNRILGYDFTPHLAALWYDDEPEAKRYREDYRHALAVRLEETYYRQLHQWCEQHRIPLTGHPGEADDYGAMRYFHLPGQDMVWRWILPDTPSALEGAESTQAKCSSSAALHSGRRRNANECCGAYGHELTWEEMQWLARWCLVRGVNLLYPHAFYYSMRGPRRDERPPDVGPNSPWWDRYPEYADACRRISWLNTDSEHVCSVAILTRSVGLPWRPAKACFQHQFDFNYLEEREVCEQAKVSPDGIRIRGMTYRALIVAHEPERSTVRVLEPMARAGRILPYGPATTGSELIAALKKLVPPTVQVDPPAPALRVRHVRKAGFDWFLLFNEERPPLQVRLGLPVAGARTLVDVVSGDATPLPDHEPLAFARHAWKILAVPAQ